MKKFLSAVAMIALVTAGAAHAQTTTPAANPSANGVQNEQSAPTAKAADQGTVKKAKTHQKSVKSTGTKTQDGSTGDVAK